MYEIDTRVGITLYDIVLQFMTQFSAYTYNVKTTKKYQFPDSNVELHEVIN